MFKLLAGNYLASGNSVTNIVYYGNNNGHIKSTLTDNSCLDSRRMIRAQKLYIGSKKYIEI